MKKQQRVALVCASPVSRNALSRLPGLRDELTWVKGTTPSATGRAANALGGHAVRDYADLTAAAVVLIRATDEAVAGVVEELLSADLDWHDRTVVLFESGLDSTALAPLARAGAHAASLNHLDASDSLLLLEGAQEARRRLRRLLARGRHTLIELKPGTKDEYLSAVDRCTNGFMPVIAAAVDGFMRAGMEKAAAEKTAASLFERSLRAYLRAGKRLLKPAKPQASAQA